MVAIALFAICNAVKHIRPSPNVALAMIFMGWQWMRISFRKHIYTYMYTWYIHISIPDIYIYRYMMYILICICFVCIHILHGQLPSWKNEHISPFPPALVNMIFRFPSWDILEFPRKYHTFSIEIMVGMLEMGHLQLNQLARKLETFEQWSVKTLFICCL